MPRETSKPQITIPRADEREVANIPSGDLGNIRKRFDKIDQILFSIMFAVVLGLVAIIVSVIGIFLDQMRYNNAAYKEYSERTKGFDSIQNSNRELLEQNKQNQELIIKQQGQILELLNKK